MTTSSSIIMENKCANCSASLEFEPDENCENQQNELILKRYYSLDVKSRFKTGGGKPPLGSHSQTPRAKKSSSDSAVEDISIRRALSLIFNLEIEPPSSDPADPSSPPPPAPALPICFVCHLILNDLYRAYIEFSELRQNNSYLGRELLKLKTNLNCGRQERDGHENVRFKTGAKRPRMSSGSVSENSSFRERRDKQPIFQNSQPEENEASGLGIGISVGADVDVVEAANDPVRVKFEVFHDETGTEAEEAQNDNCRDDYEYENAESMDLGHTLSSYKSEPDEEELQDRFSVEDETEAGGMAFVNIAASTSYSRPHHSRVQVDPGSSSSSFSVVSPYVEEDDTNSFAAENTGHDPLSIPTSSFASTRSRYFRGTDSTNYEMILPNSGLGHNISQLTGSLISSPAAAQPRRRGPSQGQGQGQHRDQGVPVQLRAGSNVIQKTETDNGLQKAKPTRTNRCQYCGEYFETKNRLYAHRDSVHMNLLVGCRKSRKMFWSGSLFQNHLKEVHKQELNVHQCASCYYMCKSASELNCHWYLYHPFAARCPFDLY